MNTKTIFTSSYFVKSVFALSLLVLVFISYISYRHSSALSESTKWVMHTYEVQMKLEQLFSHIKDAETSQRGYIITHNEEFLSPYTGVLHKVNRNFIELHLLLTDNAPQKKKLDLLSKLIDERFDLLEKGIELNTSNPENSENINSNLIIGKKIMDQIRVHINDMIALEKTYLTERQSNYKNDISFTPFFTVLLLAFSLVILIFSYVRINQDFFFLKKSNEQLSIANESMDHAEKIGRFSTWQWDLQANKFTYSDNQFRLFGVEPNSFEPNTENFLKFVHPEDRHVIIRGGNEVINENKMSPEFYRILRNDGEIRYFKSIAKLVTTTDGKKTFVGINRDITEQHLSNIELEEKNLKLEQSVQELKSFNHVASHDLQEPLRKIQTFLSRIPESDWENLSEKGKEFITKSRASAERMRTLIDDLLLFSSTNKTEKIFTATDLNQTLENAKQELASLIEEKQAQIISEILPSIQGISFQIQQLFINLIGNSLKYSRKEIAPLIKIDCSKVDAIPNLPNKNSSIKSYYKITFSDNGMGFDQKHAENIFVLFNRLHTTDKFPGTGIGLAICKKIVENHSGHIEATSVLNQGAVFTIYLPE